MTRSFVGYVLSLVIGAAVGAVAMHWKDSRVAAQEAPASKAAAAPVDAAAEIALLRRSSPLNRTR